MSRTVAVGLSALLVAVILAGCSPSESGPVAASPAPATPGVATSSDQEPEPSDSLAGVVPVVVDVGWESMLRVENPDTEFQIMHYGEDGLVTQTMTISQDVTITHTDPGGKVSTLDHGNNRYVQRVWKWGDDYLLLDSVEGGYEEPYQLELWTPGKAKALVLDLVEGTEWLTEAVIADNVLFFITASDTDMCLFRGVRSGDVVEREQVTCVGEDEAGLSWLFADGPTVSWMTTDFRMAPNQDEFRCNKLYRLTVGVDVPELVPGADCVMRGLASADTAAWSDAPIPDETNTSSYDETATHVLVGDVSADVGIGSTGGEKTCGGLVFWSHYYDESNAEDVQIQKHFRTWDPEHGVRMLSVPPSTAGDSGGLSKLHCIDGSTIGVQRFNVDERVVEYFIADISSLKAS